MAQDARPIYRSLLHHRDFLVFWTGSLLSGIGSQFTTLSGAGDTISAILRTTIDHLSTPDELRGRMSSINSIFTTSGPQLGQFESGLVAAWLGAELSAMTGGLATLIVLGGVVAAFPKVRQFQIAGDPPPTSVSS